MFRFLVNCYLDAYAMTRDIWAPIVEAVLNIGGSLILGHFWGLNGILLAVVLSLVIMVEGWKPFFLIREGMVYSVKKYIERYVGHLVLAAVTFVIGLIILSYIPFSHSSSNSWLAFIGNALLNLTLYVFLLSGMLYLSFQSFRSFVKRLRDLI